METERKGKIKTQKVNKKTKNEKNDKKKIFFLKTKNIHCFRNRFVTGKQITMIIDVDDQNRPILSQTNNTGVSQNNLIDNIVSSQNNHNMQNVR